MSKISTAVLTIFILALAVVFGVLPGLISHTAEKKILTLNNSLNKIHAPLRITQYKRGWFKSTATVRIGGAKPIKMTIYNGPIIFHNGVSFAIAKGTGNTKIASFNAIANIIINYNATGQILLQAKETKRGNFQPESVLLSTFIPNIRNANQLDTTITANHIKWQDRNKPSSIKNIIALIHAQKVSGNWVLNLSLNALGLKIQLPANDTTLISADAINLSNFKFDINKILKMKERKQLLVQHVLSRSINKKTLINIVNLKINNKSFKSKINFQLSWPTLPKNPSELDWIRKIKLIWKAHFPQINILNHDSKTHLKIQDFHINFNRSSDYAASSVGINHFELSSHHKTISKMVDFTINANTSGGPQDNIVNTYLQSQLANGCVKGYCIHDNTLSVTLKNVSLNTPYDLSFFKKIVALGQQIERLKIQLQHAKSDNDRMQIYNHFNAAQKEYFDILIKYYSMHINHNTKLMLKLVVNTPEGQVNVFSQAHWPDADHKAPPSWLLDPTVETQVSLPRALASKLWIDPAQQQHLLDRHCVTQSNRLLQSTVLLSNKKMTLNGKAYNDCFKSANTPKNNSAGKINDVYFEHLKKIESRHTSSGNVAP